MLTDDILWSQKYSIVILGLPGLMQSADQCQSKPTETDPVIADLGRNY